MPRSLVDVLMPLRPRNAGPRPRFRKRPDVDYRMHVATFLGAAITAAAVVALLAEASRLPPSRYLALLSAGVYLGLIASNGVTAVHGVFTCTLLLTFKQRDQLRATRLAYLWNLLLACAVALGTTFGVPLYQASVVLFFTLVSQRLTLLGLRRDLARYQALLPLGREPDPPVTRARTAARRLWVALQDAIPFSGIYGDARGLARLRLVLGASARELRRAARERRLARLVLRWARRGADGVREAVRPRPPAAAVAAQPSSFRAGEGPLRVTALVHDFGLGGATLAVTDALGHLRARHGALVRVVSPTDGLLRARCETLGLESVVNPRVRLGAGTLEQAAAAAVPADQTADLVVGASLAAALAVPAARAHGCPSLLYVQESLRIDQAVAALYAHADPAAARALIHDALTDATRVCFTATATRELFASFDRGHFRTLPDTVEVGALVAYAEAASRAELRRKHDFGPLESVIVCVGTISHRKGQHVLLDALEVLRRDRAGVRAVLVGLRETPDLELDVAELRRRIARLGIEHAVRLVPETDAREFFALADVYACPSLNEAFPRSILEAMAFGLPIVATRVAGVVEQIDESSGWLCAPGDAGDLAAALQESLDFPDEARRRGRAARARAQELFDAQVGLERHAQLAFEAAAGR